MTYDTLTARERMFIDGLADAFVTAETDEIRERLFRQLEGACSRKLLGEGDREHILKRARQRARARKVRVR